MSASLAGSTVKTTVVLGLRLATLASSLVLLARILPPEIYGPYAALASLAVLLGLLPPMGLGFVMLSRSSQGKNAIEDVWRTAWPLSVASGAVLLILLTALVVWTGISGHLGYLVPLGVGAIELTMMPLIALCNSIHQAHNQVARGQFLQLLPLLLRLVAMPPCLAVDEEGRLVAFILGQLLATCFALLVVLSATQRRFQLSSRPKSISLKDFRQGAAYCAMHIVAMNPSEIDKIAIIQVASAHEAGIYSICNRILGALITPVSALLLSTQPSLFRMSMESSRIKARLILRIALYSAAGGLLASVALVIGSTLLPLLFGAAYQDASHFAPMLACVAIPLVLRVSSGTVLVALGHPGRRLLFEAGGVLVLLALIGLLVPAYGLPGAAVALGGAESLMAIAGWLLVVRALKLPDDAMDLSPTR